MRDKYFNKYKLNNESFNNDYVLDNNILNKLKKLIKFKEKKGEFGK